MAPKNIVVCADGTWNEPSAKTNVWQIYDALPGPDSDIAPNTTVGGHRRREAPGQTAFYLDGVGTTITSKDLLGGATGFGLHSKILDAYLLLSAVYRPGDRIFLFGFSRGAYTVRALAGFIAAAGLLHKAQATGPEARAAAHMAWLRFKSGSIVSPDGSPDASDPSPIQLVGVFDTVGALGIPFFNGIRIVDKAEEKLFAFANLDLSPRVAYGLHAVAIDEKRLDFTPTLWNPRQGIEQSWFAGVHCDVGGGYASRKLADITLEWMLSRAEPLGLLMAMPELEYVPKADRHESATKLWKLRTKVRDVPVSAVIDQSVRDRFAERDDYAPAALAHLSEFQACYPPKKTPERINTADKEQVFVRLELDESIHVPVWANRWWNAVGLEIEAGDLYSIVPTNTWQDGGIGCDADGWGEKLRHVGLRRVKNQNWFKLCLARSPEYDLELHNTNVVNWVRLEVARHDAQSSIVAVGLGATVAIAGPGALYLFANDLDFMYFNNSGCLDVTITRLAPGTTPDCSV